MFAIAEIKGHQYKVSEGDKLNISRIADAKEGEKLKFVEILLLSDKEVTVGMPFINGAYVEVKILGETKADKIKVFKMKPKKRYRRTQGHRQKYTQVEVVKIATKKTTTKATTKKEEGTKAPAKATSKTSTKKTV